MGFSDRIRLRESILKSSTNSSSGDGKSREIGKAWNTECTEWQRPLSGVHSIMMEKLAQAGEGMGVLAHSPEREDTLPLFHTLTLYIQYVLCGLEIKRQ
jgi:hypothetical protein